MNVDLDLLPGKYSVIAIAEFTGTFEGQNYKFWNISNDEHLQDLNIVESSTICNSPLRHWVLHLESLKSAIKLKYFY